MLFGPFWRLENTLQEVKGLAQDDRAASGGVKFELRPPESGPSLSHILLPAWFSTGYWNISNLEHFPFFRRHVL